MPIQGRPLVVNSSESSVSYGILLNYLAPRLVCSANFVQHFPGDGIPFDLFVGPPDSALACANLLGPRTLLFTMFEATGLRPEWVALFNKLGGVIVPSEWGASCFSAAGVNVPIYVCPLGVNPSYYRGPIRPKKDPDGPFVFSTVLSSRTGVFRKGLDVLLPAFREAFIGDIDDVQLKVHCTPELPPFEFMRLADGAQNITFSTAYMNEPDLASWIRSSDAGVFPFRGEGFGLCPLQYIASSIPCILSRFSGVTQYVGPDYELSVKGNLAPTDDIRTPGMWFSPSSESLVSLLRRVRSGEPVALPNVSGLTWRATYDRLLSILKVEGIVP